MGIYSIRGCWTLTGPLLLSLFCKWDIKDIKKGQFCIGVLGMQKQIRCYTIIVGLLVLFLLLCCFFNIIKIFIAFTVVFLSSVNYSICPYHVDFVIYFLSDCGKNRFIATILF